MAKSEISLNRCLHHRLKNHSKLKCSVCLAFHFDWTLWEERVADANIRFRTFNILNPMPAKTVRSDILKSSDIGRLLLPPINSSSLLEALELHFLIQMRKSYSLKCHRTVDLVGAQCNWLGSTTVLFATQGTSPYYERYDATMHPTIIPS